MVKDSHNTDNTGTTPDEPPAPEWGTTKDAMDITGLSRMTIHRYAKDGRIRTRRKGPRMVQVDLTSLDDIYGPLEPAEAGQ